MVRNGWKEAQGNAAAGVCTSNVVFKDEFNFPTNVPDPINKPDWSSLPTPIIQPLSVEIPTIQVEDEYDLNSNHPVIDEQNDFENYQPEDEYDLCAVYSVIDEQNDFDSF